MNDRFSDYELAENLQLDEERALYGRNRLIVRGCRFDGPADGESALKECSDIVCRKSYFNLRYPFWHDSRLEISDCEMTELCRAALWYSSDIKISGTRLHGIKALRECSRVEITDCDILSPEFGWFSSDITIENTTAASEYFMLKASGLKVKSLSFTGKYSFQYIKDSVFEDCTFMTKDAFWHSSNVLVKNSVVNGEYLAWYSDGLTLENCLITGTQPLCYCSNLRLINCRTSGCDLSFEKSEVDAEISGEIISIKNPASGVIRASGCQEIIRDDPKSRCEIIIG